MQINSKRLFVLIILSALALLACQTTELISGFTQNNQRAVPTRAASKSNSTNRNPVSDATRDPNADYSFDITGTPRCTVGDNNASVITGQVTDNGNPSAGQQVQASSAEGGEPINTEPAQSDQDGNFQVDLVCGGSACNGTFWVWLVDPDNNQTSPYVQFVFDDQCRRGSVNFTTP